MASAKLSGFRRRNGALWLAAVLLVGLLAALLMLSVPAARADGPQITLSTSTTNPGGEVFVNGTGWSPAKHYNLYVYSQRLCNGMTTCPVPSPASKYLIGSGNVPIKNDGTFSFDFTFSTRAATITYVFTAIADYPPPPANPYTASVPEQVVPAGTPPSGTPISSSPAASPTAASTNTPAATATSGANPGGGGSDNGNQNNNTSSGSSNKAAIAVVGVLLFIMVVILIILLVVLPPKRRAIRAAYYGSGAPPAAGRASGAYRRQSSGAYPPTGEPEQPWQGGVALWDDEPPRPPRGSGPAARDRYSPRPPRRPTDRDY